MNRVLESVKYVVENSRDVKINHDAIKEFSSTTEIPKCVHWINESPFDFVNLNDKQLLKFLFVFNTISFCFWETPKWIIEYRGNQYDGAWALIASIGRAFEEGMPILDFDYIANVTEADFQEVLRGSRPIPLFHERLEILKQTACKIHTYFGSDIYLMLSECKFNAALLLDFIINNFPAFSDVSQYLGRDVYFYKRAQLLISDISRILEKSLGKCMQEASQLTACADYKLPQVLRSIGILEYSRHLSGIIDNKLEILHDSNEEVEIRANTVWAVESIKDEMVRRGISIESMHINDYLWLLAQVKSVDRKPYHLTRTTCY